MNKNKKIEECNDDVEMGKFEPYLLQLSIKAVVYDSDGQKFLLVKDVDEHNFFSTHFGPWELPGGRLQKGESILEGLNRELREELGDDIQYELVDILGAADIEYKTGKAVASGYLVLYKGGEVKLSQEHSEYNWETAKTIAENSEYKPWLKTLIERAVKRLEERSSLDGWKRCQADFENYKKRQAENQKELIAFSNQNLVLEILPILDNFHASTDHIPEKEKDSPWVVGIMHIQKQLEKVLEDNGIKEIEVKVGDEFNPEIHEAILQDTKETNINTKKTNHIKKVLQKGYKMGGRVVRAARVVVE